MFTNLIVQCSYLGIDVAFCGMVGNDEFGESYLNEFSRLGIKTNCIGKCGSSTGLASILIGTNGANKIVVIPGANFEINDEFIGNCHSTLTKAKVTVYQNEIPLKSNLQAMTLSTQSIIIYNPAPAYPLEQIKDLISHSSIVCPNEHELHTITAMPTNTNEEVEKAAACLLAEGCGNVVVTLGARGALVLEGPIDNPKATYINADSVEAVDTVGAGDSFIGRSCHCRCDFLIISR
jgi:ribokinase